MVSLTFQPKSCYLLIAKPKVQNHVTKNVTEEVNLNRSHINFVLCQLPQSIVNGIVAPTQTQTLNAIAKPWNGWWLCTYLSPASLLSWTCPLGTSLIYNPPSHSAQYKHTNKTEQRVEHQQCNAISVKNYNVPIYLYKH